MADSNPENPSKLAQQARTILYDLHARNLAIPAGVLLAAIVAAMFVLPKSAAPPPPVETVPTAVGSQPAVETAEAANLTFVSAEPLDGASPEFGSYDPFARKARSNCTATKTSTPKEFKCVIGSTVVTYACQKEDAAKICEATGSTGATGGAGFGDGSGGGSTGGGDPGSGTPPPKAPAKSSYYVVRVTYDNKVYKDLVAGDQLPKSGTGIVLYAGPDDSAKKAIFVLGDGVTVQGAQADEDLGNFELAKGDDVVLTGGDDVAHTLTLDSIKKVTR